MTTLIYNATIVNEGELYVGSLLIEDDKIAAILRGKENHDIVADHTTDATGQYLLPGAIDDHVHFRDPGLTHKADMRSESRAAAQVSTLEVPTRTM